MRNSTKDYIQTLYDVCCSINPTEEDVDRCRLEAKSVTIFTMSYGFSRFHSKDVFNYFVRHISAVTGIHRDAVEMAIESDSFSIMEGVMLDEISNSGEITAGAAKLICRSLFMYKTITLYDKPRT